MSDELPDGAYKLEPTGFIVTGYGWDRCLSDEELEHVRDYFRNRYPEIDWNKTAP